MSEYTPSPPPHEQHPLWYEGPNYTADAVIINTALRAILLIRRRDTGEWALPGGFIEPGEEPLYAARREAEEEAGIRLRGDVRRIYHGRVEDPRNTETSWIETSAFLFTTLHIPHPTPGDDASHADWQHLDALPALYASHHNIVAAALKYI